MRHDAETLLPYVPTDAMLEALRKFFEVDEKTLTDEQIFDAWEVMVWAYLGEKQAIAQGLQGVNVGRVNK